MIQRLASTAPALALVLASAGSAQYSSHALRFHGSGGTHFDRLRIAVDDDQPGPDASAPCDIGAGSFTIELWLRGSLADNPSAGGGAGGGGDAQTADSSWNAAHVLLDRSIAGGSSAGFGVSLAGGHVRFGTDGGDGPGADAPDTIEGSVDVLDGSWHHLALVRDATTGQKRIYVDGLLDFASSAGASLADLSYPDDGVPGQTTPFGNELVLGAEKHGAGEAPLSFAGHVDELRLWTAARAQSALLDDFDRPVDAAAPGLVGLYRMEEGAGTAVADESSAGSPTGTLSEGTPGNGEWTDFAVDALSTAPLSDGILPWGFVRQMVVSNLVEPIAVEVLPQNKLLIAERRGWIRLVVSGQLAPTAVIAIDADVLTGERGLLGIAADPAFSSTGWIYVFYTTHEPRNRVARFTVVDGQASPASEMVLWEGDLLGTSGAHHGGCLRFGLDGMLYVSTGDQDDSPSALDLGSDHGKILRLAPDGSVPPDNPLVGVPGALPSVWASGLRNPFRFSIDPFTGMPWIGDVGGNGFDAWEELNAGAPVANFGWPNQEGPNCFTGACGSVTFADLHYRHDDPEYAGILPRGAIIGGPRYTGSSFPPHYQGNLFFGDYANRWIRRAILDENGAVVGDPLFLRSPNAFDIVDLAVGPVGELYTLSLGLAFAGEPTSPSLWKFCYVGGGVQTPVAVASADSVTGSTAPHQVQFSSAGTYDPVPGPAQLQYSWYFGDGVSSNEANPSHAYQQMGDYHATLTVSDGMSSAISSSIHVVVGNEPVVTILGPLQGAPYQAGQSIAFSGTATDVEDGNLPASAFTWKVLLHHAYHLHPVYGPLVGTQSGSYTIPASGHSPEDTTYIVTLTVVDSSGLNGSATVELTPIPALLAIDTVPSGIPVLVDGEPESTPYLLQSLLGFQHAIAAQPTYQDGATLLEFECWSDGGPAAHTVAALQEGTSLTAVYAPAPAPGTCAAACGFSTYGSSGGPVNHLGIVGTGSPALGGLAEILTNDLGDAPFAWFAVSAASASIPLFGGDVLVDLTQQVTLGFAPNRFGQATWPISLPTDPGFLGARFYLQTAALDPIQPFGIALSGGLELTVCP